MTVAWEDRTPEQQAEALRAAAERDATDDNHLYVVTTSKGTRLLARGINSARVLAGTDGSIHRQDEEKA